MDVRREKNTMEEQEEDIRQNQEDVNPGSQLDKLVTEPDQEIPNTNGTGSNRPVPTSGTVIIKDEKETDEEEAG